MDDNNNKQIRIYDESEKYIRLSVDETIARKLNQWQGWQCSAGVRGLYIDYDGNLWRCNSAGSKIDRFNYQGWETLKQATKSKTSRIEWPDVLNVIALDYRKTKDAYKKVLDNTEENKNLYPGFLGNIYDGYDLPTDWFKCPWELCGCGADVSIAKAQSVMHKILLSIENDSWSGRDQTANLLTTDIETPVAVETNFPLPYQILWDIGRRCNYDCSYCWTSVHNRVEEHKDFELLKNTSDKIIDEWANGQTIRWAFGGGEPTLHPQFLDWMKHLKSKNQWTMVTSNGTRDFKYWSEAANYLNSILLSAHFDGLHSEKEEDRFVRNIEAICKTMDQTNEDKWIEVKLMAPPKYLERAIKLKEKILSLNLLDKVGNNGRIKGTLSIVPIRSMGDSSSLVEYTEEQLAIMRTQ